MEALSAWIEKCAIPSGKTLLASAPRPGALLDAKRAPEQ
jgi:hypothetical protein